MSLKYKITDVLYATVFLWGIITIGSHSAFVHNGIIYWLLRVSEIVLVIIALLCSYTRIVKKEISCKNIAIIMIIVFATYMSCIKSGRDDLFISALWIIAFIGMDFRRTVGFYFKGELLGFISVLVCSATGIITNKSFIAIREGGNVVRYYMGFVHANAFAGLAMQMTALYLYLNFKRIKNVHFLLLIVFNYCVYILAYSRTSFLLSIVLIIGVFVNKYADRFRFERIWEWIIENLAKILLVVGFLGSVLLAINYEKVRYLSLLQSYDSLLSRIRLISDAMNVYDITLFGQSINFVNSNIYSQVVIDAAVIDNAFIFSLLQFGVVNTVLIIFGYIRSIKYVRKEKDNILILCTIIFIIYGFTEKYFVELTYNFTLLIFSCIICKGTNNRRRVE